MLPGSERPSREEEEPVRDRRAAFGLVATGSFALLAWAAIAGPLRSTPIPADESRQLAAAGQVAGPPGDVLYTANCSACHGPGGQGTANGPALTSSGAAAVDFMLRTGRMPLPAPDQPVRRGTPAFDDSEIAALVAYVSGLGDGPPIPPVQIDSSTDIAAGRAAYIATCAACHGAGASGDAVGGGAIAPPLLGTAPTQVGEAIRIGPGAMPAFDQRQISDEELSQIAGYLQFLRDQSSPGGQTVGGVGPVAEGYVGWIVYLVALLGITRWIERRRHG
jgi:ubiquinol-cytochrome c reductase cytochrome c subunit